VCGTSSFRAFGKNRSNICKACHNKTQRRKYKEKRLTATHTRTKISLGSEIISLPSQSVVSS
jgi:hypothetical protein